jgi:hypothetical protein
MPIPMSIEVPDLGRLVDMLEKAGGFGASQLKSALNRGAIRIQRAERIEAPRDTSNLAANINIIDSGEFEVTITPKAKYALDVHNGRKPGSPPPVSALQSWADRHGINVYALQKSIDRKGTKPNPFVERAIDGERAAVQNEFTVAADKVADYIARG